MVLQASEAQNITETAIAVQTAQAVANEVFLTEAQIRRAGRRQRLDTVYNAQILGNPAGDPSDDEKLTAAQIEYRDHFVDANYVVGLDPDTGWWSFAWSEVGPEQSSVIYSIRTTVTPGAVADDTIDLIEEFFDAQNPAVTARVSIVEINGGDIDETDFGATISVFYEYTAVVTQTQQQDTNFSADLTDYIINNGQPQVLKQGQDETDYNGAGNNGTFTGGTGYSVSDVITLSDNSIITVNAVAGGVVTQFTVTTSGVTNLAPGTILVQTGVVPSGGTGFTLTPQANNLGAVSPLGYLTGNVQAYRISG